MLIHAIDPGSEQSAFVSWDGRVVNHGIVPNDDLLRMVRHEEGAFWNGDVLVIEQVESFGMAVGVEVFRTVWWCGRFHQAWWENHRDAIQLTRRAVKLHLCHSARATDANVRQALIDRFGPTKAEAIGTKYKPGPLYGLKGHEFAALGVVLTFSDSQQKEL